MSKLSVYFMSVIAGMFALRAGEAFRNHHWSNFGWDVALVIGWSLFAWYHLSRMKETT